MQGIFSRRLRKRIDANTLTNGQTDKQSTSQAKYNAVPKMARAPQFASLLQERNGKPFCFCPEVNSARISGAGQPIKLREKH